MKVAIITLYGDTNYGNRLQNFALQKYFSDMGHEVKTIVYRTPLRKLYWSLVNATLKKEMKERRKNFLKFNSENIPELWPKRLKDISNDFDLFVVGSDQIWNPYLFEGNELKFLKFADKRKCISYSSSIGISKLPKRFKRIYKKGLSNFSSISLREMAGAQIVEGLGFKDVKVVVDPTMLLSKEEWQYVCSNRQKIESQKPYLLTYFLGKKTNYQRRIEGIAKKYGLEIKSLNDLAQPELYTIDPFEFVNYISKAALVCTDSFHGTVFSILNEVPFMIFNRDDHVKSMNSRIDTLLEKTNLSKRLARSLDDDGLFSIDFSEARNLLKKEREAAKKYLDDAIEKVKQYDQNM